MLSKNMREELVQGLLGIFQNNIAMIILCGSRARNEATNESIFDCGYTGKQYEKMGEDVTVLSQYS